MRFANIIQIKCKILPIACRWTNINIGGCELVWHLYVPLSSRWILRIASAQFYVWKCRQLYYVLHQLYDLLRLSHYFILIDKQYSRLTQSDLEVSLSCGCSTQNLRSSICLSPPIASKANGESLDHIIWNETNQPLIEIDMLWQQI